MKLYSIKSEVRYSPTMILVKLVGSYTLSQVSIRISDIKRTKMVGNCFYSLTQLEGYTSMTFAFCSGADSESLLQQ